MISTRAVALDPDNALAYDSRGAAYSALNDPVKAQEDFDRAIDLDPELASAYLHRSENWLPLSKTPVGRAMLSDAWNAKRTKLDSQYNDNMKHTPWQPLHATKGPGGGPLTMARLDRIKAKELEEQGGGGGGAGSGTGGSGAGGGGGSGGGGGEGDKPGSGNGGGEKPGSGGGKGHGGAKGSHGKETDTASAATTRADSDRTKLKKQPPAATAPLVVYPQSVTAGTPQVLVADSAALAAHMPSEQTVKGKTAKGKVANNSKQSAKDKSPATGTRAPLAAVDFYRDKNGNEKFDADADELLTADVKGADGFVVPVDTSHLSPGKYHYFAVPKGAAPAKGKAAVGEPLMGVGEIRTPHTAALADVPAVTGADRHAIDAALGYQGDQLVGTGQRDSAALGYWHDRDYPAAMREYDRLLEENPQDAVILGRRGQLQLADGRYQDAITDYDRLIKLGTADAQTYYNRGCTELASGDLDQAVADFTAVINLNENSSLAYNNRGTALARQGAYREALADFETALRLDAQDNLVSGTGI